MLEFSIRRLRGALAVSAACLTIALAVCSHASAQQGRLELAQSDDRNRERYDYCMAQHFGAGRNESEIDYCAEWAPCDYCRPPPPPPQRTGPCADIVYYPEDGIFLHVPNSAAYMAQSVETGASPGQGAVKRQQVIEWFRGHLQGWTYYETGPRVWPQSWWFEKRSGNETCRIEVQDTYPVSIVYGPYPPDQVPRYGSPIPH